MVLDSLHILLESLILPFWGGITYDMINQNIKILND